jgi:hypothetical protein
VRRPDSRTEVTNAMILVVYPGTIKSAVLRRIAVRCSFFALLFAAPWAMAQNGPGLTGHPPVNPLVAPQAHVDPHTIILPVVDGHDLRFARLSTDEGLSQTKVAYVVQDDQGFMWFATQDGLNRYDGYSFKLFVHEPRDPNSLSGVYVRSLFKDRDGVLWAGCDQFLNKFDRATETFTKLRPPH